MHFSRQAPSFFRGLEPELSQLRLPRILISELFLQLLPDHSLRAPPPLEDNRSAKI